MFENSVMPDMAYLEKLIILNEDINDFDVFKITYFLRFWI